MALYDATVSLLESPALSYLASGVEPPVLGNAHFSIAPFDSYACADRDVVICAGNDALFAALVRALGVPHLAADPRFATNALRYEFRAALDAELEAVLRTAPAEHGSASWTSPACRAAPSAASGRRCADRRPTAGAWSWRRAGCRCRATR